MLQALDIAGCGRHAQEARAKAVAVQLFALDEIVQPIHGAFHVCMGFLEKFFAAQHGCRAESQSNHGHGEGPIPPAGAVADRLGFQDRNLQARFGPFQFVCGRQAAESACQ